VKLLLDEMYPAALAERLRAAGIDTTTVAALGLAGTADAELFAVAVASGYVVLTENVGDFTRLAAEHGNAGSHHPGLLVALSSRFSRRLAGAESIIAAVSAIAEEELEDRVVYLEQPAAA
jgi:predicted nuclease of predicted toxin-antitoxin system